MEASRRPAGQALSGRPADGMKSQLMNRSPWWVMPHRDAEHPGRGAQASPDGALRPHCTLQTRSSQPRESPRPATPRRTDGREEAARETRARINQHSRSAVAMRWQMQGLFVAQGPQGTRQTGDMLGNARLAATSHPCAPDPLAQADTSAARLKRRGRLKRHGPCSEGCCHGLVNIGPG